MDQGLDRVYLPNLVKSLFINNNLEGKEVVRRELATYMVAYTWPRGELEAWVCPKVEAWAHRVRTIYKISK